ncbi:hypothetical protein BOTBODRAFT_149264 [Botryobasidium botryosum FD-172 SS1]|uniref:Serine/threonine-protein kinase n=1 Tax=Botryobasidium botryosum (strain FD-172 SS1) TaxID=930990 RepID=A0A067M613_BOTB1|nr:hypothetical protein BOTBODRAFT_149264 [Botryobasidium botryosum FD-172 SS1]
MAAYTYARSRGVPQREPRPFDLPPAPRSAQYQPQYTARDSVASKAPVHANYPTTNPREIPPKRPSSPPVPKQTAKAVPPSPPVVIKDVDRGLSWTRVGFLGEGGFARVYEIADERGARHAVKVVTKASLKTTKSKTKLYAEIKLHRALQHPHIVSFEECFEDEDNVYMTLELCENGSMMDMLRRRKRYTEPETRYFLVQLIGACHYMHTHQVIHRDLKLGNLFLDSNMNVKVGDFGLAALIESPGERKKTICGTPNYIAPEVLFDTVNGHSFEVDTWSIGVIIYTLVIGKPPFQTKDVKTIYTRIRDNKYEFPPDRQISADAQDLISSILTPDPQQRPSLHEIVAHPFFTNGIVPSSIPLSAQDVAPSFSHITRSQSRANLARLRRQALLDEEVTEIKVGVPSDPSLMTSRMSATHSVEQQEREFHKAVQPGSPISALLSSARQPLIVANAGNSTSQRDPTANQLFRKLSAAAPSGHRSGRENQHRDREVHVTRSPPRQPLSSLAIVHEQEEGPMRPSVFPSAREEQEWKRNVSRRELESQKARIVAQMAESEMERPASAMDRDQDEVGDAYGMLGIDEENLKPIRPEIPSRPPSSLKTTSAGLNNGPALKVNGFDAVSLTLAKAFDAKDQGKLFRDPALDANLVAPSVFIVSWVDYCHKYGMGYALTDGSVGVHFNDSTSLVLSADKHHVDYISSRRSGSVYVRKNYTLSEYPEELKSKMYLLTHFEDYMMDHLYGEHGYTYEDLDRTHGMDFVQKYLRMKHIIVFKMSHDILQFNFYDHTKMVISSSGLHITYIDKHHNVTCHRLSELMAILLSPSHLDARQRKGHERLLSKIKYCKEVLNSIRMAGTSSAPSAQQVDHDMPPPLSGSTRTVR